MKRKCYLDLAFFCDLFAASSFRQVGKVVRAVFSAVIPPTKLPLFIEKSYFCSDNI